MKKNMILLLIITFGFAYNGSITGVTYFDATWENKAPAFNFNRQYFNYAIQISNDMKLKVVFDAGRTNKLSDASGNIEDTRLVVFLKKAQLDYKSKWGKTSLGLIGTNTYGIQEKNWGYRFIEKSAMDNNNFVSTVDLGIGFSRIFFDDLNLSIQLVNGEGYKRPQSDTFQRISFNATYGESNLFINEGFNLGLAYSYEYLVSMLSMFGGFSFNGLRVSAELDLLTENNLIKNLISLTSAYSINNKIDAFARYDIFEHDKLHSKYFISGIMYDCGSGLLISPNIRSSNYFEGFVYRLNFQFTF